MLRLLSLPSHSPWLQEHEPLPSSFHAVPSVCPYHILRPVHSRSPGSCIICLQGPSHHHHCTLSFTTNYIGYQLQQLKFYHPNYPFGEVALIVLDAIQQLLVNQHQTRTTKLELVGFITLSPNIIHPLNLQAIPGELLIVLFIVLSNQILFRNLWWRYYLAWGEIAIRFSEYYHLLIYFHSLFLHGM